MAFGVCEQLRTIENSAAVVASRKLVGRKSNSFPGVAI